MTAWPGLERTPRIMWNNLAIAAATTLSASSSLATAPVSFLRDQLRSKRWRSASGWTFAADFNVKLDFSEAGNVRVATITAGTYATGALAATAVQTALNAAPSASNTYTCTYSSGTHLFTIARASGADAVVLLFSTGTNAAIGVGPCLGYAATDLSGATTYDSAHVCYQSRQWLKVDLGAETDASSCILGDHNLSPADTYATMVLQSATSDSWTTPASTQSLTSADPAAAVEQPWTLWASWHGRRWHRLVVNNTANPDGYTEVGLWHLGAYLEPSRSFDAGYEEGITPMGGFARAESGALWADLRDGYVRHAGDFRVPRADRDLLRTFERAVGVGGCFFLALDPLNYPMSETYYGALDTPLSYRQTVGDGSPPDWYEVRMSFVEALG